MYINAYFCSGKKLWDYVKYRSENASESFYQDEQILRQVQDMDLSDPESEHSYSDLINDYASNKSKNDQSTKRDAENDLPSDESFEKLNSGDLISPNRNLMDEPVPDLLTKSSVELKSKRKFSEMSSFDDLDLAQNFLISEENIVKWAAQLLIALEKLHALGVIC